MFLAHRRQQGPNSNAINVIIIIIIIVINIIIMFIWYYYYCQRLLRVGMEDIQHSSEAGTQGHAAPIPNQKTSAGRPFQPECVRAFVWPNVHCPGVDAILLVHM